MRAEILHGDCLSVLRSLPSESVYCCVTSPPYWGLRDYGVAGQLGLEKTPEEYVGRMVDVFREVRRVLREDGVLWLNLGDSYAGSWGNQGRKEERGSQRPINGPMLQRFAKHAPGCDMDEDCSCLAKYAQRDSHTGSWVNEHPTLKPKDLVGIPWRVAFALQADGWYLRSDIIWAKPNPMPESVTDRPTKSHEYLFLLAKSARYWYDAEAIAEAGAPKSAERYGYAFGGAKSERLTAEEADGPGTRTHPIGRRQFDGTRNARSVWTIATQPYPEAHFATFPEEIPRRCIRAGCPVGGVVLDPFCGSGTTGAVAISEGREFVGIELNPAYVVLAEKRLRGAQPPLFMADSP